MEMCKYERVISAILEVKGDLGSAGGILSKRSENGRHCVIRGLYTHLPVNDGAAK